MSGVGPDKVVGTCVSAHWEVVGRRPTRVTNKGQILNDGYFT